jgi:hypothetical protein
LPRTDAPADERKLFDDNARRLLKLIPENKLFCAEIYRELGEFDKSLELLNDVVCDPRIATIAEHIRERASRRDSSVFIVAGCGECERTAIKDEEMIACKKDEKIVVYETHNSHKGIERKSLCQRLLEVLERINASNDETEEF